MSCPVCGGALGHHSPGCPEDPSPETVAYQCDECGGDIFVGEECFRVDNRHYCTDCCCKVDAEAEEVDRSDEIYDAWRDREFENG